MTSMDTAIKYFLLQKFGGILVIAESLSNIELFKNSDNKKLIEVNQYKAELTALPKDELIAMYKSALENDALITDVTARREEKNRFYNLQSAFTDFEYLSKAAYWSLDEAIALSFSRDPEIVSWEKIAEFKQKSDFVKEYARLRDLALRALHTQKLSDPVIPFVYINWAISFDINLPDKLLFLLKIRSDWDGMDYAESWHEAYIKLKHKYDELRPAHEKLHVEFDKQISIASKPESKRKIDNLLQAIAGIAIYGYKKDDDAERTFAAQDIANDISKTGKSIDSKTIRGWIDEGIKLLPKK